MDTKDPARSNAIREYITDHRDRFLDVCRSLVEFETPSNDPRQFDPAFAYLEEQFSNLDFTSRRLPGEETAGCLYARPREATESSNQLLIGHLDTVWSAGTLENRPFTVNDSANRASGPGIFDMKAGLTEIILALECLDGLSLEPQLNPLVLINSDEEIGSPESTRWIKRLSKISERALVFEPSMGPEGKIKTARKGIGHFTIEIQGRASHAGLSPEKGSSAILELSHLIQELNDLNDPEDGVTVNVGVIEGGTRSNVVAAKSVAEVDVRVLTNEQARHLEDKIRSITPENDSIDLVIDGGFRRPPMERTDRNRRLWRKIQNAGQQLGIQLEETRSGGGSDGNTASQHTATIDGLGAVGGGAHEKDEYIEIEAVLERTALLVQVLLLD